MRRRRDGGLEVCDDNRKTEVTDQMEDDEMKTMENEGIRKVYC